MNSEDEDEDDPLGDTLGNLDDFSDSEADDAIVTVRPYRATDQICFVPVDHQPNVFDMPSNAVATVDTPTIVPIKYTNTATVKLHHNDNGNDDGDDDNGDDDNGDEYSPYGPGQIDLSYDDDDSYDSDEFTSLSYSDDDAPVADDYAQPKNVDFAEEKEKRRSIEPIKPLLNRIQSQKSLRNILQKHVSSFKPKEFDICLLVSAPLVIKNNPNTMRKKNKSPRMSRAFGTKINTFRGPQAIEKEVLLEYIRSSLPDRLELQQTVRQTLVRRNICMRYAHFTATAESIEQLSAFGGCKVLQYVGYCCNPRRDNDKYPILCKSLKDNNLFEDEDYILLETEAGSGADDELEGGKSCFGKGIWYKSRDLYGMLNANKTQIDCIIAMSPQHERLIEIFKSLGYQYIIGVEASDCATPFSTTETSAFLRHLYAALLEQRSVSRAYYLSLQAALTSRGSVRGGNETDPKYILEINQNHTEERFIIFDTHYLKMGEIIDKSQHEKLPRTNLREPVRPFFGRTQYVIHLLKKLTETQIVNVTGKELIGRASVVKSTTRYLLQMGFFRGGCFVIDCKLQSRKKHKSFNECVYDVLKSTGIDFNISHYLNDDEEEEDVPLMNSGLTVPIHSRGHYSSRSSSRFPALEKIQQSPQRKPMKSPPIGLMELNLNKKEAIGDPKASPRALFEYFENSIFYDQKPPCHEPFCFVILNMNHWYSGTQGVTQWITAFSEHLLEKEDQDSRIICTGKDPLNINTVSTLNMKRLKEFDRNKLARLFKYFCKDLKDLKGLKFNPSLNDITQHDALQNIFGGRPGMTKKVSQYVRYLFASNDLKEYENGDANKKKKNVVTLDEIAKNYPTSEYAMKFKESQQQQTAPQAYAQKKNMQELFQEASKNSLPAAHEFGAPQFQQMDESFLTHSHNEGIGTISPYPTGSTSSPDINGKYYGSDPAVLIPPEQEAPQSIIIKEPQTGVMQNSYPNININYYYHHHPAAQAMNHQMQQQQKMYMGYNNYPPQYYYNNNNNNNNNSNIPPPPPPGPVPPQQQSPYSVATQVQSFSHMPSSRAFASNSAQNASQSMSQINSGYRNNNNHLNPHPLPLQNAQTGPYGNGNHLNHNPLPLQNAHTGPYGNNTNTLLVIQDTATKQVRYNESIETLKQTAQKKQNRSGKTTTISNKVASLFGNNNDTNPSPGNMINKSQKVPLDKPKTSLKLLLSDESNKTRQLSVAESRHGSVFVTKEAKDEDSEDKRHRLRELNKSIMSTPENEGGKKEKEDEKEMKQTESNQDAFHVVKSSMVSPPLFPRQENHRRSSSLPDFVTAMSSKSRQNSVLPPIPGTIAMNRANSIDRNGSVMIHRNGSMMVNRNGSVMVDRNGSVMIDRNASIAIHIGTNSTAVDEHHYNRSNLVVAAAFPGHSIQFSNLTEISVLNERQNGVESNSRDLTKDENKKLNALTVKDHEKNTSYLVSPIQSSTQYDANGTKHMDQTSMVIHEGNQGMDNDDSDTTTNKQRFSQIAHAAKGDSMLDINHSFRARTIWHNSSETNIASLQALYPHLIDEFLRLTKCQTRRPTLQQIELFFVRTGGVYGVNDAVPYPYITADKFDKFFAWFRSMCCIINDLRPMYNSPEDPLVGLFYGRKKAQETLEHKPEGTFILRLASSENGLAITYKNPIGKIQNVLLTRIGNETYKVGKSDKETLLFHLIRPWPKLKYLYTPNKLIKKKMLF